LLAHGDDTERLGVLIVWVLMVRSVL
jgi:hypothetical protein